MSLFHSYLCIIYHFSKQFQKDDNVQTAPTSQNFTVDVRAININYLSNFLLTIP